MRTRPENHPTVLQLKETDAKPSPSVARAGSQPAQLQGARFQGPVTKITTVDSPIRPGRKT